MLKYTLKRIVLILFTLFIILTIAYFLMQLTTSFEERVKFYQMSDPKMSYEEAVIYGKKAGWDDPILIKYFNWIKGVIKGNWGVSVVYEVGQNPWTILTRFIPFTISINIWPLLIATPLGFLFGIIAALRKNKPTDYIISLLVMICISVPSFVFVTLLMINATNMGLPIQFRASSELERLYNTSNCLISRANC